MGSNPTLTAIWSGPPAAVYGVSRHPPPQSLRPFVSLTANSSLPPSRRRPAQRNGSVIMGSMDRPGEVEEVYAELRKIASAHLSRSPRRPSLQATQLVHEAWLRLSGKGWKSRTHFLALASHTMRMLVIDALRARMAARRGSGAEHLRLEGDVEFSTPAGSLPVEAIIEVDRALDALAVKDERKARVVEMRFFGGLEMEEIAEVLGVSLPTVKRDWVFARAWLFSRLSPPPEGN